MANNIKHYIPNTLTCLNLLSGCLAVVCAFSPFDSIAGIYGYQAAFCMILSGAFFDFLDGFFARVLKETSPIGADLDSLSDMITFGLAPSMILLNLFKAAGCSLPMQLVCLLIPLCGALRLARFNVYFIGNSSFSGLPIPSGALFCIGLADIMVSQSGFNPYAAAGCTALVALLMIAPLPMYSLKFKSFSLRRNAAGWLLVAVSAACVIIWGWTGFLFAIVYYVLSSFVIFFYRHSSGRS